MDYKKILDYFDNKKNKLWSGIKLISIILIAVAAVMFVLGYLWLYSLTFLCMPVLIVGVAALLTSLSMTTSESYLKQQLALARKGSEEKAFEYFGFPEDDSETIYKFEWYDLSEADDLSIRKTKNGRVYSTRYIMSFIYLKHSTMMVWSKSFSLISDASEIQKSEIPYTILGKPVISSGTVNLNTITGKSESIHRTLLGIYDKDGNISYSLPVRNVDYDTDRFIESVVHHISRAAKTNES